MLFDKGLLIEQREGYRNVMNYYHSIRSFFEVVDVRLASEEYGAKLKSVSGSEIFASSAYGYHLYNEEKASPFYLWTPSWLGRCYADSAILPSGIPIHQCTGKDSKFIAFVWTWLGVDDAFLRDAHEQECWFGVTEAAPDNPSDTLYNIARTVFYSFRSERTVKYESDGWISGNFYRYKECQLNGYWFMKRIPLSQLTSFYQVESIIIRPVVEKFSELADASTGVLLDSSMNLHPNGVLQHLS